jgi:DNA-binding response OmpR family regulator
MDNAVEEVVIRDPREHVIAEAARPQGIPTMVEDGIAGINAIENTSPDLIITDVMIPFKNGIEIINHAKKFSPKVPIIVLSSLGEEEGTVMEAFNLGASDFIPKPFNPNELAMRVKRLINN